ncbi:MAG TPA: hypothetical protein PKE16_14180 [Hyphomicrobium sp.]|nr:hypothetical protein [Hyphomicrobium sp.]
MTTEVARQKRRRIIVELSPSWSDIRGTAGLSGCGTCGQGKLATADPERTAHCSGGKSQRPSSKVVIQRIGGPPKRLGKAPRIKAKPSESWLLRHWHIGQFT